jgi:hypothetical protein
MSSKSQSRLPKSDAKDEAKKEAKAKKNQELTNTKELEVCKLRKCAIPLLEKVDAKICFQGESRQ